MILPMDRTVEKTILNNGLTVISETLPTVRSISLGIWVQIGSRYENKRNNGLAHFWSTWFLNAPKTFRPANCQGS